jgi:single-stranded DNA-binding protein
MIGNQIVIHGNIVKEPKIFTDKRFAIIRLASNYNDKRDGQKTMFFDVKVFGDRMGDIDYFDPQVGDRLAVTGSLALDEYEKDGSLRSSMVIYCDHFEKIWRKPKSASFVEDRTDQASKADF